MALGNAKKFVQMIQNDEKLKARVEKMSPAEALAAAKEMGLDFTAEELKAAAMDETVSLDELDEIAGGRCGTLFRRPSQDLQLCPKLKETNGKHPWERIGHIEEPHSFLWIDYTKGYNLL